MPHKRIASDEASSEPAAKRAAVPEEPTDAAAIPEEPAAEVAAGSSDTAAAEESELQAWSRSLAFSTDETGKEQLLDANGTQVMMEWERPYMIACVDALRITSESDVLEIGFGCAYSAERIQSAGPRSHTIVECSEPVLERLREWAADRPSVRVVAGTWQSELPKLGEFDCIFFDDFGAPGLSEREMMQSCASEEYRAEYEAAPSHFHAFVHIALRWHLQRGGRMTGYLVQPLELKRDDVDVSLRRMPVAPPAHCHYFDERTAVVPTLVKR